MLQAVSFPSALIKQRTMNRDGSDDDRNSNLPLEANSVDWIQVYANRM